MSHDEAGREMGQRRARGSLPRTPRASPSLLRRATSPLSSPLLGSSSSATVALFVAAASVVLFLPPTATATRHNFSTYQDARFLVGPVGAPYGFLRDGEYNLTVFDFELTVGHRKPKKRKKTKKEESGGGGGGKDGNGEEEGEAGEEEEKAKAVEGFEAGFLLKRFDSESDFAKYQEVIMNDPSVCSYEPFREKVGSNDGGDGGDERDDPLAADDDDEFNKAHAAANPPPPQSSESVAKDGIFLSMRDVGSTWRPNTPSVSHTFKVGEEGLYFLMYQVCPTRTAEDDGDEKKKGMTTFKEVRSTFELDLAYKNYDALGNPSYLTAGEMPLPTMFLYFSVSYALCLCIWVANIRQIQRGGNGALSSTGGGPKPTVYAIHHMMTILLLLKTLSVFFESVRYHYIRVSGHAELWSTIYYAFAFLKGTFLFTVILLIGSGWSFVKPFLNDREKKVICLVLVLQVIDNVAVVILTHETVGERLYDDWSAVLHLVDILCCCAVLVPIVWQVNALESSVESTSSGGTEGETEEEGVSTTTTRGEVPSAPSGDSARTLQKLKLFRSFYLLVISYIYFTRIAVFLFATILGYRRTWLRYFVTELGTLAFYVVAGFQFRPMVENPYLEVKKDDYDDDDRAGAGSALEMGSVGNGGRK